MYCPSCGGELAQEEMSYCNRCGASLKSAANLPTAVAPAGKMVGATWAISLAVTVITICGFGVVFSMLMALVTRGVNLRDAIPLLVISMLVVLTIDWLLIRQLSRVINRAAAPTEDEPPPQQKKKQQQKRLSEKPAPQLSAPRQPISSVTDHTTRTFEPVHRTRDTQK